MSLMVYDDTTNSGIDVIIDNNSYFELNTIPTDCSFVRLLIEKVEGGTYKDNNSFISKLGYETNIFNLSSGSKTILNIYYNSSTCFDLRDCGNNALSFLLKYLDTGTVYWTSSLFIYGKNFEIDINYNGVHYTDLYSFQKAYDEKWSLACSNSRKTLQEHEQNKLNEIYASYDSVYRVKNTSTGVIAYVVVLGKIHKNFIHTLREIILNKNPNNITLNILDDTWFPKINLEIKEVINPKETEDVLKRIKAYKLFSTEKAVYKTKDTIVIFDKMLIGTRQPVKVAFYLYNTN